MRGLNLPPMEDNHMRCVVALGDMVKHAQNRAYEIADGIKFDGCQMRRDIGYRAIGRK